MPAGRWVGLELGLELGIGRVRVRGGSCWVNVSCLPGDGGQLRGGVVV